MYHKITKKIYINIVNSIKQIVKTNTIFMNSKNSKTSRLHRLLLNVTDKTDPRRKDKYFALSSLSIYYTRKT